MKWYEAHYYCNMCKGCEKVADGEAQCYIELEDIYEEEDYINEIE